MSFGDDEFGGLLDRESVLTGGVPARRANTVLFLIESRTAHLVARSRQAMERYLSQEAAEERELAFLDAFALGKEPPLRPTIQHLERPAVGASSAREPESSGGRRAPLRREIPVHLPDGAGHPGGIGP